MQSVFSNRFLPQNKDFLLHFPHLAVLSLFHAVILQPISERYHAMSSSSELQTVDTCRPFCRNHVYTIMKKKLLVWLSV